LERWYGGAVTTLWLTAGLFQQMVEERLSDLPRRRQLLAGGDVLPVASGETCASCRLEGG